VSRLTLREDLFVVTAAHNHGRKRPSWWACDGAGPDTHELPTRSSTLRTRRVLLVFWSCRHQRGADFWRR
jgi:hypothetical protein